jgi:hypothetical protein
MSWGAKRCLSNALVQSLAGNFECVALRKSPLRQLSNTGTATRPETGRGRGRVSSCGTADGRLLSQGDSADARRAKYQSAVVGAVCKSGAEGSSSRSLAEGLRRPITARAGREHHDA